MLESCHVVALGPESNESVGEMFFLMLYVSKKDECNTWNCMVSGEGKLSEEVEALRHVMDAVCAK